MTEFVAPETVYGVDFSGARRAGDSIYVAEGVAGGRLSIRSCVAAPDLLNASAARDDVLPTLASFVADAGPRTAFGFDFSFGLPSFLLDAAGVEAWEAFVRWFSDAFDGPSEFSDWARAVADGENGDRTYYARETDAAVGATSPYHFFVKAQTFYGIRDVLRPLVAADATRVLPMQSATPEKPWALEAYPAATLDRLGAHRERYKTDDETGRRRRRANLDALASLDGVSLDSAVRETALADADGDALDAVVAAVATWRHTRDGAGLRPDTGGSTWRREGHIYA
ncbi:DUF429 domain-containing protein [Halogeometricum limi]|uniref:DUF429 domain-containing protein n=1 Tax=Halogeometricum limi TaxID=555875 RepID=A0A1I6G6R8_9EURY|nr:DUF429 domain-containing protein [Halogeometricum limi]SFR37893.1 Protein of unknown function [Halogeometricum limi]